MSIRPFFKLFREDQLSAFVGSGVLLKPFYKLVYLTACKNNGLFELLSEGPADFDQLAKAYCTTERAREALEAWLQLGIRLGQLELNSRGYALRGLASKLAIPKNDAMLALLQEVAALHYKLIAETPAKLRNGELWSLKDQDGEIIARSSRILESFQTTAIDRSFPNTGAVRLLEVGCGSGFYIKYAAMRNPNLSALGLELQPDVAEVARRNLEAWGLRERVRIEGGDIREKATEETFDIATLYNNIYYFPVEERIPLLRHVRGFIKHSGFLLLTTCCQGGGLGIEVLNLWGAATGGCGRLPSVDEMTGQLREAGYGDVETFRLMPGEAFFAFKAMVRK